MIEMSDCMHMLYSDAFNECLQYCVYMNPYDDHLPDDAFHVNLAAESS